MMSVEQIALPKIIDARGNLSFFENESQIPFCISRVYWIYDVPGGEFRGGHAFKNTNELIIALSGSFDVIVNDGKNQTIYNLNRSYKGLLVPKMNWRQLVNFSTNSLALIVADREYDSAEYLRDFLEFENLIKGE